LKAESPSSPAGRQGWAAAFERVAHEGPVDLLVNNVWGGYEQMLENGVFTWSKPFWEQPLWRWDAMFAAGVRAHYYASQLAARAMVAKGRGLIVNISFRAAQKHIGNVAYGVSKAATDKLTADMAAELQSHGVALVSLGAGCCGGAGDHCGPGYGNHDSAEGGVMGGLARFVGSASAPVLLWKTEPEYSEEARKAKVQGTLILRIEVDARGQAQLVMAQRSLGLGLGDRAVEAVRRWKFKPGNQNGKPVVTVAIVEVNFRLL
jgi:TonB family protein